MKICVLGLDCAAPEIVFGDERLVNLRRLMEAGVYGRLESVYPPITVPAWMCMCTSQDPGSLGVYGFRNRVDHSKNETTCDPSHHADPWIPTVIRAERCRERSAQHHALQLEADDSRSLSDHTTPRPK